MPRYTRFMHDNSQTAALWDDATRIVTTYDETGAITSTRPYTEDEHVAADTALADAAQAPPVYD